MEKVIVIPGFEITPNIPIPSLRGRVVSGEELGFISATADFRSYHCFFHSRQTKNTQSTDVAIFTNDCLSRRR